MHQLLLVPREDDFILLLRAQKLTVGFRSPWDALAKTTLAARERDEKNPIGYQHLTWCSLLYQLRTHFETSVDKWVSPHPSPQGEPLACESTLQQKELAPVTLSALPPTSSVAAQRFTASASTHVPAPANLDTVASGSHDPSALPTGSREKLLSPYCAAVNGGESVTMSLGLCSFSNEPLLPWCLVFTNDVSAQSAARKIPCGALLCFGIGVRMGNGTSSWIS